ncbi:MAG: hypothetical protein ACRDTT_24135 [Pseudonocardiaceae bacterium]
MLVEFGELLPQSGVQFGDGSMGVGACLRGEGFEPGSVLGHGRSKIDWGDEAVW